MIKTRKRRVKVVPGDKFPGSRLTVVDEVSPRILSGKPCRQFLCKCDCGEYVDVLLKDVRGGAVKSCGCLHDTLPIKHGHAMNGTRGMTYRTWSTMRNRCLNKNAPDYPRYGGRGITICERWNDFSLFLKDMGPRPSAYHSIDRFPDTNGNYEPGNCRWATSKQQGRNRNTNRMLTFQGQTFCLAEWAELTGISLAALRSRLNVCGYTVEEALTLPLGVKRG